MSLDNLQGKRLNLQKKQSDYNKVLIDENKNLERVYKESDSSQSELSTLKENFQL